VDGRHGTQYRDSYFLFGSVCRVLAGKVPLKDWKSTVEDIWAWSKRKVDELHVDVPDFPPPQEAQPPHLPQETIQYINDIQAQKFRERAQRYNFTPDTLKQFLGTQGISDVSNIPLARFERIWKLLATPEVLKQYQ
jgi:hypothetical protein